MRQQIEHARALFVGLQHRIDELVSGIGAALFAQQGQGLASQPDPHRPGFQLLRQAELFEEARVQTDHGEVPPQPAPDAVGRLQPALDVAVIGVDLLQVGIGHTARAHAVQVDVDVVVPGRVADDAARALALSRVGVGEAAVPGADQAEHARLHRRLPHAIHHRAAARHARGDQLGAHPQTGVRRLCRELGKAQTGQRVVGAQHGGIGDRVAHAFVRVIRQHVDVAVEVEVAGVAIAHHRRARQHQQRMHAGLPARGGIGGDGVVRKDPLRDAVALVAEVVEAIGAGVHHGVDALHGEIDVGLTAHRDAAPLAHVADARQAAAERLADAAVIAGGEDAAARIHEVGNRLDLIVRQRAVAADAAEQPDLVIVGDGHRRRRGGEVEVVEHGVAVRADHHGVGVHAAVSQREKGLVGDAAVDGQRLQHAQQAEAAAAVAQVRLGDDEDARPAQPQAREQEVRVDVDDGEVADLQGVHEVLLEGRAGITEFGSVRRGVWDCRGAGARRGGCGLAVSGRVAKSLGLRCGRHRLRFRAIPRSRCAARLSVGLRRSRG